MNPTAATDLRAAAILPAATTVGTTTLRVSDPARSIAWYRDMMGLELIERTSQRLAFGAGGQAFLFLDVHPGIRPRVEEACGLYHVAILVPDRPTLGGVLARLAAQRIHIGASDHLVSEALYIWDPDNNGLEIYRDRPREEWRWDGDRVRMATDPLNLRDLLAAGVAAGKEKEPMPAGTRIGHVHLQVGDLDAAKRFYCGVLGFEETSARGGALFVSAGRYHHHIGLNVWHSRGAPPQPGDAAGIEEFEIVLPDRTALDAARKRLERAGHDTTEADGGLLAEDPWRIRFRLRTAR